MDDHAIEVMGFCMFVFIMALFYGMAKGWI